jgi:D-sedoheptulose 7-phosphate isomerase
MDSLDTYELRNKSTNCPLNATENSMRASSYYAKLIHTLNQLDYYAIDHAVELIRKAWQADKQIICFGNGGSALTAQHFITDWNKSVLLATGKPFRGRCLTENMGLITAYANDIGYEDIFVEQLKNMLEPGDLLIGISGSGNSETVLQAILYGNAQGHTTIGLCGFDGGKLAKIAHLPILAPIHDMQVSEDIHFSFGHIVMQALCHVADKVPT